VNNLKIYTDGGSRGNPGPAGIGVYVINQQREVVYSESKYISRATNNESEYKAFLASLEWLETYVKSTPIDRVEWFLDSKLVVEQVKRNWKVKEPRLLEFAKQAWSILSPLNCEFEISHVKRELNKEADALVNEALDAI
jgi:ribonuclease HI